MQQIITETEEFSV